MRTLFSGTRNWLLAAGCFSLVVACTCLGVANLQTCALRSRADCNYWLCGALQLDVGEDIQQSYTAYTGLHQLNSELYSSFSFYFQVVFTFFIKIVIMRYIWRMWADLNGNVSLNERRVSTDGSSLLPRLPCRKMTCICITEIDVRNDEISRNTSAAEHVVLCSFICDTGDKNRVNITFWKLIA